MNNPYVFDCLICSIKCDGVSVGAYIFEDDTAYSERFEKKVRELINKKTDTIIAKETKTEGFPDIEVCDSSNNLLFYIEVKAQRRTFMSVKRILPNADLMPSETVALNLSDLLRYFKIEDDTNKPIFLVWVLSNRPCVLKEKNFNLFSQNLKILRKIYEKYGSKRTYRRRSGYGDVINGVHKGVVVNYHFSLNELERGITHIFKGGILNE